MAKSSRRLNGKVTDRSKPVIRDSKGKFVKGSGSPSPGRPPLAAELPAIDGIKAAVTAEKVAQLLDAQFDLALNGDTQAARLWLAYAVGRPIDQSVEARLTALEALLGQQKATINDQ